MIQHSNDYETSVRPTVEDESRSIPVTVVGQSETAAETEASSGVGESQYPVDVKQYFEELCPVCGDKVSGYHYGLLTCESCKGFFKRTVQNKKVYSCVDNRTCLIDKSQRKRCPYCRFQKCLNVGMKLEAVRTDRMRGGRNKFGPMYKRDRALKQQALRQKQQILATCQMRLPDGMLPLSESTEPQDIKPDPALLMSMATNYSYSVNSVNGMSVNSVNGMSSSPHDSTVPSPVMSDTSAADLRLSQTVSTAPVNSAPITQGGMHSISHTYPVHHNNNNNNYNFHQAYSFPPVPQQTNIPLIPQLLLDLKASMADENEIKHKLLTFIHTEFNHEDLNVTNYPSRLLRLMCRLSDQLLFLMVEWARTSMFFTQLKVEDQMKLLQNCWSEILILDLAHRLVRQIWSGELILMSGHSLSLDCLDELGLSDMKDKIIDLVRKMKELKIDINEYICLKFLILLNPDVPDLENQEFVEGCQEKVNAALMEYCVNIYPNNKDKFSQVLLRLPEVRLASICGEEFLYYKHMIGEMPEQTLLMEMLHSKKK